MTNQHQNLPNLNIVHCRKSYQIKFKTVVSHELTIEIKNTIQFAIFFLSIKHHLQLIESFKS